MIAKEISKRISYIYSELYQEKARNHYLNFAFMSENLIANISLLETVPKNFSFSIDKIKLVKAVDSIFLDIIKFKEYHFNPYPNFIDINSVPLNEKNDFQKNLFNFTWTMGTQEKEIHASKVASFVSKWLIKYAVISVQNDNDKLANLNEYADFLVSLNERFALNAAIYCMGLTPEDITRIEYHELMYDFRFRPYDERAYFSRFKLLMDKAEINNELDTYKSLYNELLIINSNLKKEHGE